MDSIYINLIREKEQRSGSLVTRKFILICTGSILIGVLAAFSGVKLYRINQLKYRHRHTVRTLDELKQRERAEKQRDELFTEALAYARELWFWRKSQPDWANTFYSLAKIVPDNIQIERLNCTSEVLARQNSIPGRLQKLDLYCRIVAEQPETDVRDFHRKVITILGTQDSPIRNFRPIPTRDPSRSEFSFQISCAFESGDNS